LIEHHGADTLAETLLALRVAAHRTWDIQHVEKSKRSRRVSGNFSGGAWGGVLMFLAT